MQENELVSVPEPSPEAWDNYEEIKRLLVLNGIARIWIEKDTHTFEDVEVRQFTKEFQAFMFALGKRTSKSWGKMEASERTGFITLVMLGWLNSRNKQFLADHYLWPMVECVVLWLEELWVEKYVEPEKRDAAFVERCHQHSWWDGPKHYGGSL